MISLQRIDDLVMWDGLKEFARYVLSHCEGGSLPDYTRMNLMDIPHLVPHIWVYDLRDEENRKSLLINFAGERHTDFYGRNVMGERELGLGEYYSTYSNTLPYLVEAADIRRAVYYKIFSKRDDDRCPCSLTSRLRSTRSRPIRRSEAIAV